CVGREMAAAELGNENRQKPGRIIRVPNNIHQTHGGGDRREKHGSHAEQLAPPRGSPSFVRSSLGNVPPFCWHLGPSFVNWSRSNAYSPSAASRHHLALPGASWSNVGGLAWDAAARRERPFRFSELWTTPV